MKLYNYPYRQEYMTIKNFFINILIIPTKFLKLERRILCLF